jgi:thymidylate kinase
VVIEGVDASGKATQSKLLAERLGGTRFTFPNYESDTGKLILSHLKKGWQAVSIDESETTQTNHLVFQSLQTVNRLEILHEIKKAMNKGPVVMDRYWQSAVVYGALDGLDPEWLSRVQEQPMPTADINILLDVPVRIGFERRPERRDRYEVDSEYLEKVRDGYLRLFNGRLTEPGCSNRPQWRIVDGAHTVEEVHTRIMDIVNGL